MCVISEVPASVCAQPFTLIERGLGACASEASVVGRRIAVTCQAFAPTPFLCSLTDFGSTLPRTPDSLRVLSWLFSNFLCSLYSAVLHSVLAGPLGGSLVEGGPIGLVLARDIRHQRIIGVGVREQGAHGKQHLGDGQRR